MFLPFIQQVIDSISFLVKLHIGNILLSLGLLLSPLQTNLIAFYSVTGSAAVLSEQRWRCYQTKHLCLESHLYLGTSARLSPAL